MRRLLACLLLVGAGLVVLNGAAWAASGPGEIVIEGAANLRGSLEQSPTTLILPVGKRLVHVVVPHPPAHDVLHVIRKPGVITIEIKPRSRVGVSTTGRALVLDVSDAQVSGAAGPVQPVDLEKHLAASADALIPGLPDGMVASIVGLRKRGKLPALASVTFPTAAPAQPAAGKAASSAGFGKSQALAATSNPPFAPPTPGCLLLQTGRRVGIAMYRRGADTVVILDRSLAPPGVGDGNWWQAHKPQVTLTADWTALRVPTPHGEGIRIERQIDGLCLTGTPGVPPSDTIIAYKSRDASVSFAIPHPGRALTVTDPVTRALLLVGTDSGAAGCLRPGRRSAMFSLDETLVGIVAEPLSDRLALRRTNDGFDLTMDDAASIHVPPGFAETAVASVDGLTRTLSLFDEPIDVLTRRMHQRALAAAIAPLRARSDRRMDLAEAMVALGLGSEARSVLITAASDDPAEAVAPRAALLTAIASILEQRRESSNPFAAPNFPDTEEGKLWRALGWAPPAPLGSQAATIRRGMPLLLSYPTRLRDAAAAQAARVLLASDDPDALRAVDLLPDSEAIRLARARAAARLGHRTEAIAALDQLARSHDLGIMAESLREMIRLRLAAGQLAPAAAADLLDAHRFDWRLTGQEGAALLEEGDDRLRVPDFRAAFVLWQDAAEVDPSLRGEVAARRLAALDQLAKPDVAANVTASDYASIIAENADAIPASSDIAARLGLILADKFAALGLDDHAAMTLEPLVKAMPPGVARATINTQLALLDLEQGSQAAATEVLARDDEAGLPPSLVGRRRLVRARVLDAEGKSADALALLTDVPDDETLRLKAKLLMERQDWHAALIPLTELFHRLPARGALDAAQGAVALQLVAASVRDGAPSSSAAAKTIEPRLADQSERRSLDVLMAPLGDRRPGGSASGI